MTLQGTAITHDFSSNLTVESTDQIFSLCTKTFKPIEQRKSASDNKCRIRYDCTTEKFDQPT